MNKSLNLLALALLILSEKNFAQKTRTLYEHDILFGKIKQVTQIEYMPKYRETPAVTDTISYDENGKTVEMHIKPRFGTLYIAEFLYSQDSSGQKMYVKNNNENQIIGLRLDSKGNMTEYNIYFKNGKLNKKSFYKYDKDDNLISYTLRDKKSGDELTRTYKYDKNNMLIEEDDSGGAGEDYDLMFKYENFDKYGNWIKRTSRKKWPSGEITDYQTIERQIIYY
jgi:hypothetical protein